MTEPTGPVFHWEAPETTTGPAPGMEFAPHGERLVAYIIDGTVIAVLVTVFWFPLVMLPPTPSTPTEIDPLAAVLLIGFAIFGTLVSFMYFPFFWASWGQTPGMRPFGLHVLRDKDGTRFGWGTALLRLLGMYVAGFVFYLGFFWIFVDKRRRGFQDLIAGTVVVKRS
jgi:uncharacterized RDD family membrane protein YckC